MFGFSKKKQEPKQETVESFHTLVAKADRSMTSLATRDANKAKRIQERIRF